jgi:hypothetical protein
MPHQSITLDLPEDLYERVRQAAEESQRPVESVLVETLNLMFGDLPMERLSPDALERFTDEALWALAYCPLAWPQDARLRELIALGKSGTLSDDDQTEMERLIGEVDHYVLLRSKALLLLKQRGHDVERRLKLGA